ncbi:DNA polymerase III subunit alpha [Desulfosoma caldarium]|uniref:DNA-directed DNA polymerase n=1 Tax=Desulfosoma caldarium TaxID=610254 RepID=A0A3N1VG82_9BACT|nr:DNA polymerase III subunit alpha [Desulfosoma caldarium]ROR01844.1 DNA polymerase III alpha subunit [Desulfosoma caldarium]
MLWVVHTFYSFMRGVSSPEMLCRRAAERGHKAVLCADRNGFYGLMRFLSAARREGLAPVVGVHLVHEGRHVLALAKDFTGYERLCALVTRLHLDSGFSLERDCAHGGAHVAMVSADEAFLKAVRSRVETYAAVLPGPAGRRTLRMAKEMKVPAVAVHPVYFADPEDFSLHRLVRAIDTNRTLSTLDPRELASSEAWLKPVEAAARHFPHCPEAVSNAETLLRQCFTDWSRFETVFPAYGNGSEDGFDVLVRRCRKGVRWRYGRSFPELEQRLAAELELIHAKGYVDYFLVVADIVGRRPMHCGRGSAAASLVSYLLGITHVDPLEHQLVFERFLNPHRQDHPDIDVDFPWDERDELLKEVEQIYGAERFAMVANHVGFGARAAVRETAKVYGVPAADIAEVSRRLSGWTRPERIEARVRSHPAFRGFSLNPPWPEILRLAARLEGLPRHVSVHCGGIVLAPDRVDRRVPVQRAAKGVRIIQWDKDQAEEGGLVKIDLLGNRSLGVIRDALNMVAENTGRRIDYASLNPLDDPQTQGLLARGDTMGVFYVESPAMRQLQQKTRRGDFAHLVIHSSIIRPAANRYIHAYIERLHGKPWEPLHPDLKDLLEETYGILVYQEHVVLCAMALAGFQWAEADGLRKVLSKKSREQIEDYRRRFEDGCRRRGVAEDVVQSLWEMFTSFAGYSFCKPHSASYALVSFKSAWLKVHYPAEFMAAVLANGGGYYTSFAYISEARRMGLKVLGPDVNASRWKCWGKDRTVRLGLQMLQGIRRDTVDRLLEERVRNGPFASLDDLWRRVPLTASDAVVLAKSGALDSVARPLNRAQLLWWIYARCGSARSPSNDGGSNMFSPNSWIPRPQGARGETLGREDRHRPVPFPHPYGDVSKNPRVAPLAVASPSVFAGSRAAPLGNKLFDAVEGRTLRKGKTGVPDLPPPEAAMLWRQEQEALGFVLSTHPLVCHEEAYRKRPRPWVRAQDLAQWVGRTVWVKGWPITRKEVVTQHGDPMAFVSFEDETAIYETVFFPDAYRRFCQSLGWERPYALRGTVDASFGAVSLSVSHLEAVA